MNRITFKLLPQITGGKSVQVNEDVEILDLITDSRKANPTKNSIFFAIHGKHQDGHQFISELYNRGCRNFVIERTIDLTAFGNANILQVSTSIDALQKLASFHRKAFSIPVIGVTGSNGKTIVKEWLYSLLSSNYNIAKNPGSYNSQLGVPLSVWQLRPQHSLGIFEAGISRPGEMQTLEQIIKPTIGIFTNILTAHDEGFETRKQKAVEKAGLFKNAKVIIYCKDHKIIDETIQQMSGKPKLFTWGFAESADISISKIDSQNYSIRYGENSTTLTHEFSDKASWENVFHCVATLLFLGYPLQEIQPRVAHLNALPMRLEMKAGVNGSTLIDDSYSNDIAGLIIALDFFESQRSGKGIVFLSDLLESGLTEMEWINRVNSLLSQHQIEKLISIGPTLNRNRSRISIPNQSYLSVDDCIHNFNIAELNQATVLIKGARPFRLERLVQQFQRRIHGTVMEIDLNSIVHNLNVFRSQLKPETKVMAMVKAFAYGSGSNEVASVLQYHKVDYLGVAYADEGKWLRSKGIYLPVMVMNPSAESFYTIIENNLEPSIYSISLLNQLINHIRGTEMGIHIELNTGMHRLGLDHQDIIELIKILKNNPNIKIKSVYSHLSGSDESIHDEFTGQQVDRFNQMVDQLIPAIPYPFLKHILNSAGISRLNRYQFDMVRLGIGLYGVDPGNVLTDQLAQAVTLKATVSQIREIKKEETVGYGRHGKSDQDMKLATLSIGYADGFSRAFSRGVGKVLVKNQLAPVVGNVCMDMTMIDVRGIEVNDGDEVIIFGKDLPVTLVAGWINTIPYEILTNTSDRVKRVFFAESI